MPATANWIARAYEREQGLQQRGVYWRHDGNPKRPYARLRSGLISNGYFNGAVMAESPALLDYAVRELIYEYGERTGHPISAIAQLLSRKPPSDLPNRVVGPAMGAITLAHEVARLLDNMFALDGNVRTSFAEKQEDVFVFKRNLPRTGERIMLVEDTITTAGSIRKVRTAVTTLLGEVSFSNYLMVLCNRTGQQEIDGMEIISYVDSVFHTWEEGNNPFTGGKELVPVVENVKENWDLLTKDYP